MAIAGDTHAIPSRPIELRNGRVYSHKFTTNKPRELVERDIERAARRLLAGETFQMYCSGGQFGEVQKKIDEILAEQGEIMTKGNYDLDPLKKCSHGVLADWQIRTLAQAGMITPFVNEQVKTLGDHKIISYGLSSFGYDIRITDEFRIFTPATGQLTVVDPKNMDGRALVNFQGNECIIPPNSFALARTVECFSIPRNVMTICVGKSTYARVGIIINVTPFEPEWKGYATIEISNTTPLPCKVYAWEGIGQLIFFQGEEPEKSYADRQGKYQDQPAEVVLAKV